MTGRIYTVHLPVAVSVELIDGELDGSADQRLDRARAKALEQVRHAGWRVEQLFDGESRAYQDPDFVSRAVNGAGVQLSFGAPSAEWTRPNWPSNYFAPK